MKHLLFTLSLLFCATQTLVAQSPFDGNALFDLLGQSTSTDKMQQMRAFLSTDPTTKFSETTWFSQEKGLELGLKSGQVVRVFVHGISQPSYGIKPYAGTHPLGIDFNSSDLATIRHLGEPAERKSWGALLYYVAHQGKTYCATIEFNEGRQNIKHTFLKLDEDNHSPTLKSADFATKNNPITHTDTKKPLEKNGNEKDTAKAVDVAKIIQEGCLSGDCKNGMGAYIWEDGKKYIGEFKASQIHGHGTYYFPNGDSYVGEWKDNIQNGYGVYEYTTDGKFQKYMGQWKAEKRHGFGYMMLKSGVANIGQWVNGKYQKEEDPKSGCLSGNCQNGQSTYIWEDDGSQFTGNYSAGKRNGAGIYHYGKGGSYEGNFKDGLRSGQGTYYFPNGSKYVGNWQADKRKGFGTLYRKGGETIKGTWGNGKLLKRSN